MYLFCCYADVVMYFANEFYCFYCAQYGLLKKTWMWEMVFVPNAVWFIVAFLFNVTTLNCLNFGLNVEAYRINFMDGCAFNAIYEKMCIIDFRWSFYSAVVVCLVNDLNTRYGFELGRWGLTYWTHLGVDTVLLTTWLTVFKRPKKVAKSIFLIFTHMFSIIIKNVFFGKNWWEWEVMRFSNILKKSKNTGIDLFFYKLRASYYHLYLNGFILDNAPCSDCNQKSTNTVLWLYIK